ncbi:hypothetical protein FQA47_014621 [Oryzias melastigma]|uniref:Uncharacterized protein n=1 Tax=Oryzias melastigma TaxID=30732 RepID=A0A834KZ26_ORYME|nr:hypothetical protein FQA47_014621 [Oryzias melastigma]
MCINKKAKSNDETLSLGHDVCGEADVLMLGSASPPFHLHIQSCFVERERYIFFAAICSQLNVLQIKTTIYLGISGMLICCFPCLTCWAAFVVVVKTAGDI